MARKKVAAAFKTWDDVDNAMREIIEAEGCVDEVEIELNRIIATAKEEAERRIKPMTEKIRSLEVQMRAFVESRRSDIDGKTQKLNFGRTGFRLSTRVVVPSGKLPEIINALRRYEMLDCIAVKESVNKEALKKYAAEDVTKTGAYLKTSDEFWYEVDKETLKSPDDSQ